MTTTVISHDEAYGDMNRMTSDKIVPDPTSDLVCAHLNAFLCTHCDLHACMECRSRLGVRDELKTIGTRVCRQCLEAGCRCEYGQCELGKVGIDA